MVEREALVAGRRRASGRGAPELPWAPRLLRGSCTSSYTVVLSLALSSQGLRRSLESRLHCVLKGVKLMEARRNPALDNKSAMSASVECTAGIAEQRMTNTNPFIRTGAPGVTSYFPEQRTRS